MTPHFQSQCLGGGNRDRPEQAVWLNWGFWVHGDFDCKVVSIWGRQLIDIPHTWKHKHMHATRTHTYIPHTQKKAKSWSSWVAGERKSAAQNMACLSGNGPYKACFLASPPPQLPSPHCTGSNSGLQRVGNSYFLILPGMMAKASNPSTWETREEGSWWQSKLKTNVCYMKMPLNLGFQTKVLMLISKWCIWG